MDYHKLSPISTSAYDQFSEFLFDTRNADFTIILILLPFSTVMEKY